MNKYPPNHHVSKTQTGATLIVVLLFLLLIVLVGVIAVRSSMTSLRLATSDQADTLLLTTSDNMNKNIENIVNSDDEDAKKITSDFLGLKGLFGYFMNIGATNNRGDQIMFCYRPREDYFFDMSESTILTVSNKSKIVDGSNAVNGFCEVDKAGDYINARQNVMTQVSVTRPNTVSRPVTPFEHVPLGKSYDSEDNEDSSPSFRVNTTSFLPALSDASKQDIADCLAKPSEDADSFVSGVDKDDPSIKTYYDETRNECLTRIGVPAKVIVGESKLENISDPIKCIEYGKGDGQISKECQKTLNITAAGTPPTFWWPFAYAWCGRIASFKWSV